MKTFRNQLGQTQQQVAAAIGTSPLAILRYEQFLYEHLSPKLIDYYAEQLDLTSGAVGEAYQAERAEVIKEAQSHLKPPPNLRIIPGEHPFETFRKAVSLRAVGKESRMSFCILLALHPATVAAYEKGDLVRMPSVIVASLYSLDPDYLETLDDLGRIWHGRRH